jgi:hypothetical protein
MVSHQGLGNLEDLVGQEEIEERMAEDDAMEEAEDNLVCYQSSLRTANGPWNGGRWRDDGTNPHC